MERARINTKESQIYPVKELNTESQPHDKYQPKWNNRASKNLILLSRH